MNVSKLFEDQREIMLNKMLMHFDPEMHHGEVMGGPAIGEEIHANYLDGDGRRTENSVQPPPPKL